MPQDLLIRYVRLQLNAFFPDGHEVTHGELQVGVSDAVGRLEFCFQRIKVARYCADQQTRFNHLYSDQYLMFLWFLSNALWKRGGREHTLNKVYLLNKSLHAFDCAFDTSLPDIFIVIHGVGTVLGKATYSDFLAVYQGCTVGQTQGHYPTLGRGVGLGAGASVVGKCTIGDNASVGTGCALINTHVPPDSIAYRDDAGALLVRQARAAAIAQQYFSEAYLLNPAASRT